MQAGERIEGKRRKKIRTNRMVELELSFPPVEPYIFQDDFETSPLL